MPDWYELIVAARFLGVSPWELAERPLAWLRWALTARRSEAEAEAAKAKMDAQRARVRIK